MSWPAETLAGRVGVWDSVSLTYMSSLLQAPGVPPGPSHGCCVLDTLFLSLSNDSFLLLQDSKKLVPKT